MTNISTATPAALRQTLRNMRAENLDASTQLDLIHSDIIGINPATFEHNGGNTDPNQATTIRAGRLMMRCLAKNAARTAAKLRSASRAPARRIASVSRSYPKFAPGMSTAEYVKAFADFNNSANPAHVLPYDLSAYRNPCTLYEGDALDFEPIEQPADAPDLAAEALQPVSIVSELTGATMASIPREKAEELAAMIGATINPAAPAAYTIKTARHSKTGAMVIMTPSPDGYRTRASRLAATFGKYSHRQGGYVVTASGAAKFVELYAAGWDCSYLGEKASDRTPPTADQPANVITTHNTEAARQVSELIASATAAAAIEQADASESADAPELATVDACSESEASATTCDASSASSTPSAPQHGRASSRPHQAPPKPTHDAHGQRIGQRVAGNSGHWCAVMFTDPDGRPSFEFDGPGGLIEALTFATGRERMAALQAMARQADQAAQDTDDQDDQQTERERRLNAFDAMTATAADVQAMGAEYVAQLLDDLEDINYHTEGLILQALAAGREDLAARARANLREHLAAGYLTDALRLDRQAISEALRQSTEPDPTHPAGDTPSSDPTSAQGYAPPAPDAHQQTAPVPNLADKVPRAVGADSGPASNPPGATAPSAPAPSAPAPSAPAPSAPAPDTEASADEPEPEFTRTAPQPFDMLAMIAAGLAPADFVGLGIVYSGDRANPSGCGAITDVEPCSWYKYTVTVTLEDGRQSRLNPVSFTDHLGNRYRTNFKRHGAPYLAELSAARLAVEAADKAAKQAAADEKDRQRRELPQQWPQLKAYDPAGKLSGCTLAAANIRILLKEKFPGIKFSVKTSKFSGGDDINVSWTDGPAQKDVEAIADLFSAGSFDGMEDIYNYRRSVFTDLFGDSKYIFCNRDISPELLAQAIADEWPNPQGRPSVEDYQKARGAFDFIDQKGNRRRIEERLNRMGWNFKS